MPVEVISSMMKDRIWPRPANAGKELKIADDEVLVAGKVVAQKLEDDVVHGVVVQHAMNDGQQKNDEGEERENGIGGDGKGVSMHLGLHQVAQGGGAMAAQPMRQAVGFGQLLKQFLAGVFGEDAAGCGAGTQGS